MPQPVSLFYSQQHILVVLFLFTAMSYNVDEIDPKLQIKAQSSLVDLNYMFVAHAAPVNISDPKILTFNKTVISY